MVYGMPQTQGKENSAWALLLANCTITKGLCKIPWRFLLRAFLFLSEAVGEQTRLHPSAGQELPAGPERRRRCRWPGTATAPGAPAGARLEPGAQVAAGTAGAAPRLRPATCRRLSPHLLDFFKKRFN